MAGMALSNASSITLQMSSVTFLSLCSRKRTTFLLFSLTADSTFVHFNVLVWWKLQVNWCYCVEYIRILPFWIFTARSSYASAVLGIVILSVHLSVRPSVTRVLCDETIEHTGDILIPHERVIILVFGYQRRLVGDVPFHVKFALKLTHPPPEMHWLQPISAYNVWTIRASGKC